jgi:hypothetical protein
VIAILFLWGKNLTFELSKFFFQTLVYLMRFYTLILLLLAMASATELESFLTKVATFMMEARKHSSWSVVTQDHNYQVQSR